MPTSEVHLNPSGLSQLHRRAMFISLREDNVLDWIGSFSTLTFFYKLYNKIRVMLNGAPGALVKHIKNRNKEQS
jgi:hypothetical protein